MKIENCRFQTICGREREGAKVDNDAMLLQKATCAFNACRFLKTNNTQKGKGHNCVTRAVTDAFNK